MVRTEGIHFRIPHFSFISEDVSPSLSSPNHSAAPKVRSVRLEGELLL